MYSTMTNQISPNLDEASGKAGESVGLTFSPGDYSVLEKGTAGSMRIKEEALLPILMKLERRLNTLDGLDHEMGLEDQVSFQDHRTRFDQSHSKLLMQCQSQSLLPPMPSRDSWTL